MSFADFMDKLKQSRVGEEAAREERTGNQRANAARGVRDAYDAICDALASSRGLFLSRAAIDSLQEKEARLDALVTRIRQAPARAQRRRSSRLVVTPSSSLLRSPSGSARSRSTSSLNRSPSGRSKSPISSSRNASPRLRDALSPRFGATASDGETDVDGARAELRTLVHTMGGIVSDSECHGMGIEDKLVAIVAGVLEDSNLRFLFSGDLHARVEGLWKQTKVGHVHQHEPDASEEASSAPSVEADDVPMAWMDAGQAVQRHEFLHSRDKFRPGGGKGAVPKRARAVGGTQAAADGRSLEERMAGRIANHELKLANYREASANAEKECEKLCSAAVHHPRFVLMLFGLNMIPFEAVAVCIAAIECVFTELPTTLHCFDSEQDATDTTSALERVRAVVVKRRDASAGRVRKASLRERPQLRYREECDLIDDVARIIAEDQSICESLNPRRVAAHTIVNVVRVWAALYALQAECAQLCEHVTTLTTAMAREERIRKEYETQYGFLMKGIRNDIVDQFVDYVANWSAPTAGDTPEDDNGPGSDDDILDDDDDSSQYVISISEKLRMTLDGEVKRQTSSVREATKRLQEAKRLLEDLESEHASVADQSRE